MFLIYNVSNKKEKSFLSLNFIKPKKEYQKKIREKQKSNKGKDYVLYVFAKKKGV